jgi:hypothetical protein
VKSGGRAAGAWREAPQGPDANDRAERDRIGSDDVATKRTLEDRIMQLEAQLAHERPLLEELNRRLRADRVRIEV